MKKTIIATTQFIEIATGFWAFVGENGEKWKPVPIDFPQELKKNGLKVKICAEMVENAFSFTMWGQEIDIVEVTLL